MRGFSLIQHAITIAIISSLCVIAQPNYSQLRQKYIIITTLKTIQQCLQQARSLAITKYNKITIVPVQNNWSYGIIIKDNKQKFKTYHFHKNISVSWHGFGAHKINIYPNGMTCNNGHFTIRHQQKTTNIYTLVISKSLTTHLKTNIL